MSRILWFFMVDYIVREALGVHGRAVLDFWLENNLIISSIVLAYGILVICANKNLQKLAQKACELLGKEEWAEKELTTVLKDKEPDFWDTLWAFSKFPFISLPFSLGLYRTNQTNLIKLLERFFSYKMKTRQKKPKQIKYN